MKELISKFLSHYTTFFPQQKNPRKAKTPPQKGLFWIWLVLWAACISAGAIILSSFGVAKRIELATFDWRFRGKQISGQTLNPSKKIVIVAIDEKSAASLNPKIPTPRNYLSEIINFLSEADAKLIVLDVLLDSPTSPTADAALEDAIKKAGNVILPCELTGENFDRIKTLYGSFAENAAVVGFANVSQDVDNYIRRIPLLRQSAEAGITLSLPVAIYAKYCELDVRKQIAVKDILSDIPADRYESIFINFAGEAGTFALYPSLLFFTELKPPSIFFKDKIVLIGATHKDTRDSYLLTPFYSTWREPTPKYMPGVEIIANALNTLINRSFIRQMSPLGNHLIVFLLIILALMMLFRLHPLKGLLVVVCSIAFWWFVSFMLFSFCDYSLGVMQPTIGFSLAYVYAILHGFSREIRKGRAHRELFQKHVSPEVMQEIINQRIVPVESKRVTVLFSDLKDSVPWAEKFIEYPEKLVEELNEYFAEMVDVIFQYGGTLLKFTGDGLIAVYGAPLEHPTPVLNAVKTALEMQNRLDRLNIQRQKDGKQALLMRIGINTGDAVLGDIGSEKRREYTAIGDTVNVAQRTEGQCEPGCVAITQLTYQEVKEHIVVEPMGMRSLKGKKQPVMLYRVMSTKNLSEESVTDGNV